MAKTYGKFESSAPVKVTRNPKAYNEFTLTAKLSMGQLSAMREACRIYGQYSPVAVDLHAFLTNAFLEFIKSAPAHTAGGPKNSDLD